MLSQSDLYDRLLNLLDEHHIRYRIIEHAPEGRTDLVSAMRGNDLRHAAKCMVVMVKQGKKVTRYLLAVIPGDGRVDLAAIKAQMQGTYVSFASADIATELSGAPSGAVLPFSFHPSLELVVDPSLLESDDMYFNAGRLDRSLVMKTRDYAELVKPRLARIAATG